MDFNICNHLTDVISLLLALFRINVLGPYAHFLWDAEDDEEDLASRIYCGNVTTAATWSHQRLSCSLISMNRGIKLAGPLLSCHYQCFKSDFGCYKPIWYLAWSIWKKCCRLGIHVCGVLPSKALWHMFFMISLVVVVLMKTWTALVRPQGGADKRKPKWWGLNKIKWSHATTDALWWQVRCIEMDSGYQFSGMERILCQLMQEPIAAGAVL